MKQPNQRTTVKAVLNKINGEAPTRALSPCQWGQQDGLGHFPFSPAAPKKFGRAARRLLPSSGRSMIEMLGVLAIIGVLSITALAGLTYAMNKHRANTIYNDVHLLAFHVMDTGKDTVPSDFYPDSGKTYSLDTTTYADGFVVKVAAVPEKVCDRIMEVNDSSIEKIYVGSEETTSCSGTQDMGFMFLYDGTFTSGSGSSGGTSGGSGSTSGGSGSGSSGEPVDPCESIIASTDCSITSDAKDSNGCVTVKKITCGNDTYCSGSTCETCPTVEDIPATECALSVDIACDASGQISKAEGAGCTTDGKTGTCQSDGSCRPNCETGYSYNETAGQCCEDLTETDCQKATTASSGVCPTLANVEGDCTTDDNQPGTCQSGVCEATASCEDGTTITGKNNGHEYCKSNDVMDWDDATEWCEVQGRHLASMEEMCPDWDGSTGYEKCANLKVAGFTDTDWIWSSLTLGSDAAYTVLLSEGTVSAYERDNPSVYNAFCY